METLSDKTVVAKKQHRCAFCGGIIEKGERYNNQKNIFDGTLYYWKTHPECTEVASRLRMYRYCGDDGLDADSWREYIEEYIGKHHKEDAAWEGVSYREQAKMIVEELNNKTKQQ